MYVNIIYGVSIACPFNVVRFVPVCEKHSYFSLPQFVEVLGQHCLPVLTCHMLAVFQMFFRVLQCTNVCYIYLNGVSIACPFHLFRVALVVILNVSLFVS